MKYKKIKLRSEALASIKNEIMFEIASARVAGIEIIRLILNKKSEDEVLNVGNALGVERQLKRIKSQGIIQFYATKESFENNTTEAKFILNKYPEIFADGEELTNNNHTFYVKL